jgi:predicted ATPase
MRIDWLKIGKVAESQESLLSLLTADDERRPATGFKNLQDFEIDFDHGQLTTVLIGRNGSGKSNLIEAIVLIFRDLDLGVKSQFAYVIKYQCRGNEIIVEGNPERKTGHTQITINGRRVTQSAFRESRREYLPQHVFAYYSGPSNRLESHFNKHQKEFYDALLEDNELPLRPLFYARMIHSFFVLLAYFSFDDQQTREILEEHLGIVGLESVLFVLREPDWAKGKKNERARAGGDPRFWYAKGVVSRFLNDLYAASLAPILTTESYPPAFNKKPISEERLFLFVKDQAKLAELASTYKNNINFFKMLESTYISDLIREVRVRVQKKGVDESLTFTELSEGEQQLLTVLGLLKFTNESESLFLLDEPDTHLNPRWKYDYLSLLEKGVGKQASSHLIISTHDPLLIGGLERTQVQILEVADYKVVSHPPAEDPRTQSVEGLLKSELFDLPTTVFPEGQRKLNRRDELFAKEARTPEEDAEMRRLSNELAEMGFAKTFRDPMYEQFVKAMARREEFKRPDLTPEELKKQDEIANAVLDEILTEEAE